MLPSQPYQQAPDIFYRNAAQVLPLAIAYRASAQDGQGRQIAPKPNAPGSQTALVIGAPGQPLTTERDHRVKVQFAWQRGQHSQSRLSHPERPIVFGVADRGFALSKPWFSGIDKNSQT